jgi:HSP20 family protein
MTTDATLPKEQQAQADVETTRSGPCYRPSVDIVEKQDELLLVADMPGTRGEEVDIRYEDGQLSIRAPVLQRQAEDVRFLLREYGVGDYFRTFRVSEQIDASRIAAVFADGVLTLHLPKVEAVKPRKIAVKAT